MDLTLSRASVFFTVLLLQSALVASPVEQAATRGAPDTEQRGAPPVEAVAKHASAPTREASPAPKVTPKKTEPLVFSEREQQQFQDWLKALRAEAAEAGISEPILNAALSEIKPIPHIIELDRRQPEGSISWKTYRDRTVTKQRVSEGQRLLAKHRGTLTRVGRKYGVQPRFIVALWAIETSYGQNTGGYKVVDALATLAWEGRRGSFFRRELLKALKILEEGHTTPARMKGSWAGAMGQCQFMPSSFLSWAVDESGDGHKDIWRTLPDVFGSTANYLKKNHWDGHRTWGRKVRLPQGLPPTLIGRKAAKKSLAQWQVLGVRKAGGGVLPSVALQASLVQPGGSKGPTYLIYSNYRSLLHWNRSLYFATAVGLLADAIGRAPALSAIVPPTPGKSIKGKSAQAKPSHSEAPTQPSLKSTAAPRAAP